jgi:hypothetical protein
MLKTGLNVIQNFDYAQRGPSLAFSMSSMGSMSSMEQAA